MQYMLPSGAPVGGPGGGSTPQHTRVRWRYTLISKNTGRFGNDLTIPMVWAFCLMYASSFLMQHDDGYHRGFRNHSNVLGFQNNSNDQISQINIECIAIIID